MHRKETQEAEACLGHLFGGFFLDLQLTAKRKLGRGPACSRPSVLFPSLASAVLYGQITGQIWPLPHSETSTTFSVLSKAKGTPYRCHLFLLSLPAPSSHTSLLQAHHGPSHFPSGICSYLLVPLQTSASASHLQPPLIFSPLILQVP